MVDHGKQMLANVRQNPTAEYLRHIGGCFGTRDLKLILARITRGLQMAAELETRIADHLGRFDRPLHVTARASAARKPRSRPAPQPQDQSNSVLAGLATAKEIADQLRHRPVGAVLIEICGDLGIMPSDPLWDEISHVVEDHGGSFLALWKDATNRVAITNFVPPNVRFVWPKLPRLTELHLAYAAATATGPP